MFFVFDNISGVYFVVFEVLMCVNIGYVGGYGNDDIIVNVM